MNAPSAPNGRWDDYFLKHGTGFSRFWEEYLQQENRNLMCILGLGFDPRASIGYSGLLDAKGKGRRDILEIELEEGTTGSSTDYRDRIEANRKALTSMVPIGSNQEVSKLVMWAEGRRVGSRRAANIISSLSQFADYADIVVDISALPRAVFIPIIGKLLTLIDDWQEGGFSQRRPNLHVIVSENARLDSKITDQEVDRDAQFMYGFTGGLDSIGARTPRVWIPILGERRRAQLEAIYTLVKPAEICPILPMPSASPRRADDLLIDYREMLFDRLLVEARNIIYASEQNPFEVYHQILRTVFHYRKSLSPLGSCQIALSALSSKLLSIGAMLAAYELKDKSVGIAHVESQRHILEQTNAEQERDGTELFTMWLTGEPYEP
jgi:hypothetical protein